MGLLVAGRAPARVDRPRPDVLAEALNPRRAMRRTRPGRSRAFPAIPRPPRARPPRPRDSSGDASRGRSSADLLARVDPEIRTRARLRPTQQSADLANPVRSLRRASPPDQQKRPLLTKSEPPHQPRRVKAETKKFLGSPFLHREGGQGVRFLLRVILENSEESRFFFSAFFLFCSILSVILRLQQLPLRMTQRIRILSSPLFSLSIAPLFAPLPLLLVAVIFHSATKVQG